MKDDINHGSETRRNLRLNPMLRRLHAGHGVHGPRIGYECETWSVSFDPALGSVKAFKLLKRMHNAKASKPKPRSIFTNERRDTLLKRVEKAISAGQVAKVA